MMPFMPEVDRFGGMVFSIRLREHPPPHFHVRYQGAEASVEITSGRVRTGNMPGKQLVEIEAWRAGHEDWLLKAWAEIEQGNDPGKPPWLS